MEKLLKIEKERVEIGNKIIEALKKEMLDYLEKIEKNKFSLIQTDFYIQRSYYIEKRVKEIREKIINKNISNDELFKMYVGESYDDRIFNEKFVSLIEKRIVVKNNDDKKYTNIKDFSYFNDIFGSEKINNHNFTIGIEQKKLSEIFEVFKKNNIFIYFEEKNENKLKYKKLKTKDDFLKVFTEELRNHYINSEEKEIYYYILRNFFNPFFTKIEEIINNRKNDIQFDNFFGFYQLDNNFLIDLIKNFKIKDII